MTMSFQAREALPRVQPPPARDGVGTPHDFLLTKGEPMPAGEGEGTDRRRLASRLCDSYALATMREFYPPAMAVGLVGWALFVMVAVRLRRHPEVRIAQSILARVNHVTVRSVRTHMRKLLELGLLNEVNRFRGADGKTHITYALGETTLAGLAQYDARYPRDWDRPARTPGLCHATPRPESAFGSAEQLRTADLRSASELSSDQENLSSSRSDLPELDPPDDSSTPEAAPEEEVLVADHTKDHATEDRESAKAHEVIAGCYRVACPEIVLVSAPGTPAEIATVRRALRERGGEVELLIGAYRGACLVSKGDPSIDFVFANTRHLTAHIQRWRHEEARVRARQAATTHIAAVPAPRTREVSRSTAPVAEWLTAAAPLGVAAAMALERDTDGVAA